MNFHRKTRSAQLHPSRYVHIPRIASTSVGNSYSKEMCQATTSKFRILRGTHYATSLLSESFGSLIWRINQCLRCVSYGRIDRRKDLAALLRHPYLVGFLAHVP